MADVFVRAFGADGKEQTVRSLSSAERLLSLGKVTGQYNKRNRLVSIHFRKGEESDGAESVSLRPHSGTKYSYLERIEGTAHHVWTMHGVDPRTPDDSCKSYVRNLYRAAQIECMAPFRDRVTPSIPTEEFVLPEAA